MGIFEGFFYMKSNELKKPFYSLINIGFLVGFLILCISSFLASNFVMQQFGGYDLSPIIDLSWRLSNNEIPGVDFINTMPPILLLFIKLVSFGHLSWINLTSANIAAVFLTYLFLYEISRLKECSQAYYVSVALVISIPLVYTNHIWHSSLSQYSAILYFYAVYITINIKQTSKKLFAYIFMGAFLVMLSKQNISIPLLASVPLLLILLNESNKRFIFIATISGCASGFFFATYLLNISAESFIYSYLAVLGRAKPDPGMWPAIRAIELHKPLLILSLSILFLAIFGVAKNSGRKIKNLIFLLFFLMLALVPVATDWDTKFNNASFLLFICITVIFYEGSKIKTKFIYIISLGILCGLFLVSVAGGFSRERMMHVGPFYQIPAEFRIQSGYFSGLQTGRDFKNLLLEIDLVKKNNPLKKIFFGPRIEFGYMVTKTRSPLEMPLWFHPGTSYALKDESKVIEIFKKLNFDVLVFARGDRTRLPAGILDYIQMNFTPEIEYGFIDVYFANARSE